MADNRESIIKNIKDYFKPGPVRTIVLWIDEEKDFEDIFDEIEIDNVEKIYLNKNNRLGSKFQIFYQNKDKDYIVYTDFDVEDDDFVADIKIHSKIFRADKISLILKNLKIDFGSGDIYSFIRKNRQFFGNKRIEKLKTYNLNYEIIDNLYLGMMYALLDMNYPDKEEMIIRLLSSGLEKNDYYEKIANYIEEEIFWNMLRKMYGYSGEHTLKKFAAYLFVNGIANDFDNKILSRFRNYINENYIPQIFVFLDHWKHRNPSSFEEVSQKIDSFLEIESVLQDSDLDSIKNIFLFECAEKQIIKKIYNFLKSEVHKFDDFKEIINKRQSSFWNDKYGKYYKMLHYYIEILSFKEVYSSSSFLSDFEEGIKRYTEELYKMDYYYRKFFYEFGKYSQPEFIKNIANEIENIYVNWFIPNLDEAWVRTLKLKRDWEFYGIKAQRNFYSQNSGEFDKVKSVVIISDALRFEVAKELEEKLNENFRSETKLNTRVSSIPSITSIGMASLLPNNENINIKDDGSVLIGDKPTSNIDNRKEILKSDREKSTAIKFNNFMDMNLEEQKEFKKQNDLIYIYHNSIDATGDNAASEERVFNACKEAIDEIYNLSRALKNIGFTNIIITSDHGFLYQKSKMESYEKLPREKIDYISYKRRYFITNKEIKNHNYLSFKLDYLANQDLFAYFPKGNIRFNTQGAGSNFVHGGLSLQEIVIPELIFKPVKSTRKDSDKYESKNVELELVNDLKKITNTFFSLNFYQKEPVGGKNNPSDFEIYLVDSKEKIVSNLVKIVANSTDKDNKNRTYSERFNLKNENFDKSKDYYLVIKNTTTDTEKRYNFTIDILISDDFGF
ncbi:BREX-1 system phosphatase PglZ type A [Geotoga petraea]|uniref:TIGR02687 family protein n=1 Tax=Geotoga petraea TaxID=28234 RepID=A0A1G6MLQ9_9BACT|nr:BREX-1 system phosphatase PglZ type A [Geotoga petraea]SDC56483.1 TIGR02687 family protein [Geotoga petraea]